MWGISAVSYYFWCEERRKETLDLFYNSIAAGCLGLLYLFIGLFIVLQTSRHTEGRILNTIYLSLHLSLRLIDRWGTTLSDNQTPPFFSIAALLKRSLSSKPVQNTKRHLFNVYGPKKMAIIMLLQANKTKYIIYTQQAEDILFFFELFYL